MAYNSTTEGTARGMPPPSREFSRKAAIVGIGETDYHRDYKAARAKAPDYKPTPESLAKTAFERALADSGLKRSDIDGLSVSFTLGGPDIGEMTQYLGLKPRFAIENGGIMAGPLPVVCAAIAAGKCDTVAMVYGVTSRTQGRQFGGNTDQGLGPYSYYYFNPWGWSSQAAHWAFMFRYYQTTYGATEADLGAVAVQLRKNAMMNPNAVMQAPLSLQDYLNSRYIVRPLHLFDLCLVNDGGVCLIVCRADKARDFPHTPVLVAGWGESKVKRNKMHYMVREGLQPQFQEAGAQALKMADMKVSEIQHFEGYDASTFHLVGQMEGYDLVERGAGLEFFKNGHAAIGGKLPVNTSGGELSDSYMHGWNQVVEVTRQLRHEAGPRQIRNIETSMSSLAQTDQAHPIIYARGA
jgi:acetyl-CoA acetyltransferase